LAAAPRPSRRRRPVSADFGRPPGHRPGGSSASVRDV